MRILKPYIYELLKLCSVYGFEHAALVIWKISPRVVTFYLAIKKKIMSPFRRTFKYREVFTFPMNMDVPVVKKIYVLGAWVAQLAE